MSARDPDELLKDGGGEVGDLYRRLPRYEPPRRLDRAVLNEAARAVLSGRPPRRQRWIVGIGSAAGLVLAAGLAWRIGHEPMGASDAVAPTAAPRVVPVQPIDESTRARRDTPAREEIAPKPAEAPPSAEQRSAPAAGNERQKAPRKQRAEHKPPPPVPMQAEEPPPAPPAAAAPQPFSANEQEVGQAKDAEKSESASDAAGRASSGLVTKPVTSTKMRPLSPTVPSSSVELQRDMQLAPADWLAHIRDLMRQGRRQQAIESLRLFVRAHPDERVPADLRELLE